MDLNLLLGRSKKDKRDILLQYLLSDLGMDLTQSISIPRVFLRVVAMYGKNCALMEKRERKYHPITYAEICKKAYAFASALLNLELPPQGKVALFLKNSPAWVYSDLGTMLAGGVDVPIYDTLDSGTIKYILKECGASVIVVESDEHYNKVMEVKKELPELKHIIIRNPEKTIIKGRVYSFDGFLEMGRKVILEKMEELDLRLLNIRRDDVASIIYTSGTTGDPKGVMLSHRNFLSNIYSIMLLSAINENDVLLSILPLSHAFERTLGYYSPLFSGACIAYSEGLKGFQKNLAEVRPTICCVVPMILEKIYQEVSEEASKANPVIRSVFNWAISRYSTTHDRRVGDKQPYPIDRRKHHRKDTKGESLSLKTIMNTVSSLSQFVADKVVYQRVRDRLGGNIRYFSAGGAPVLMHLIDFFRLINVPVYEGYGLTETSPLVSFNFSGNVKAGTTGKLLPYVQIKFSPKDEILVKGPNVMMGYYNNPKATEEVIDKQGWLHTGDTGRWERGNFLRVTGRIKELIVLSSGKKVAPLPIQTQLQRWPLISRSIIVGDNRSYVAALIFPDKEELNKLAQSRGIEFNKFESLCKDEKIIEVFDGIIKLTNSTFPQYSQVKRFKLIPYDVENDSKLITPTGKLKHGNIEEKFKNVIAKMYK